MFGIFLLGLIGLLIWWSGRNKKNTTPPYTINQQWMDYLAESYRQAKKPAEKALLTKLLADLVSQGMPQPTRPVGNLALSPDDETIVPVKATVAESGVDLRVSSVDNVESGNAIPVMQPKKVSEPIDNATLLLYFGAFLFLAAAGLFVALAGENGMLRVIIIALTSAALYAGGLWLFRTKPKLKTPAYTFVGMGMMLAPLAGLATYAYVFKDQGPWVWFATSLACLVLYLHALRVLKNPLLEYIFLGTFVSLFESSVAILQLPVYYYGWGLTVVALIFLFWRIAQGRSTQDLEEPMPLLANVLVPASLFASLYGASNYGSWQLGVSLVLASVYYALQAWRATGDTKVTSVLATQILASVGVAVLAYNIEQNVLHAGIALAGAGLAGVLASRVLKDTSRVNVATLGILALGTGALFAWTQPVLLLGIIALATVSAIAVWLWDNRPDMYVIGGLLAGTLPYVYGMRVIEAGLSRDALSALVGGVLALFVGLFFLAKNTRYDFTEWRHAHRGVVTLLMVAVFATTLGSSAWTLVAVGIVLALLGFGLHKSDAENGYWLMLSSLSAMVPVLFSWQDPRAFLTATLVAWGWNLMLVLENRSETARWVGSIAWLLVPIAVAHQWAWLQTAAWYAGAYLVAMLGFVLARTIAKKRLAKLPLSLAELETRLKTDSVSYVAGYGLSAGAAYVTAFDGAWYLPALVAIVIAMTAYVVAQKVERLPELMFVVPFLVQCAVWGASPTDGRLPWMILASSLLSVGLYALAFMGTQKQNAEYDKYLGQASLFTTLIAPASVLFVTNTLWPMPVTLIIAGLVLLHFTWTRKQEERELAGGVVVLGLLWMLYYLGIRELQVYTHIVAGLFACYAWWRASRGDETTKDSYILATLATITIPLALQLLSGSAGGVYGWLFLCEQVVIMLVGMAMGNKLVIRWGLYAAVASVLYQLRALAWLALAVLAVFLIGLAVYQIQRSDKD